MPRHYRSQVGPVDNPKRESDRFPSRPTENFHLVDPRFGKMLPAGYLAGRRTAPSILSDRDRRIWENYDGTPESLLKYSESDPARNGEAVGISERRYGQNPP